MMKCYFRSEFQPRYEKTGKRNLRCFPSCSPTGHVTNSFCGQPVECVVCMHPNQVALFSNLPNDLAKIQFWGEIVRSKEQPSNALRNQRVFSTTPVISGINEVPNVQNEEFVYQEQTTFELGFFEKNERNKQSPTSDFLRGRVESILSQSLSEVQFLIVFNDKKISWHYSWHSSKTTCEANHCFKAIVVTPMVETPSEADEYFVQQARLNLVEAFYAPSFKLYSRHRVRKHRQMLQNGLSSAAHIIPEYDRNFAVKVCQPNITADENLKNNGKTVPGDLTQTLLEVGSNDKQGGAIETKKKRRKTSFDKNSPKQTIPNLPSVLTIPDVHPRRNSLLALDGTRLQQLYVPSSVGPAVFNGDSNMQINLLLQLQAGLGNGFILPPSTSDLNSSNFSSNHGTRRSSLINFFNTNQNHLYGHIANTLSQQNNGMDTRMFHIKSQGEKCILDLKPEERILFFRLVMFIIFYGHGDPDRYLKEVVHENTFNASPELAEKDAQNFKNSAVDRLFQSAVNPAIVSSTLFKNHEVTKDSLLYTNLSSDYAAFTAVRRQVLAQGSAIKNKNVHVVLLAIEEMTKMFIEETSLSERLAALFKSWIADPTQLTLSERSRAADRLQKLMKNDDNIHKDEIEFLMYTETVKFNQTFGRLMSLGQEFGQMLLSFISSYLYERNETLVLFDDTLQTAADLGLLPFDVKPPGSKLPQILIKSLLNNLQTKRAKMFEGLSEPETNDDKTWFEMFELILHELATEVLASRIKNENSIFKFPSSADPLSEKFEKLEWAQGFWELNDISTDPVKNIILEKVMFDLYGVTSTMIVGRMFKQMIKKIHIQINSAAISVHGQVKMLANPFYLFALDGSIQDFDCPLPVPFPCTRQKLQVVSWLDTEIEEALPVIRFVFGGSIIDRHGALQKLKTGTECPTQTSQIQQMRLFVTMRLSTDVATLNIEVGVAFSPQEHKKSDLPSMSNLTDLKKLFTVPEDNVLSLNYKHGF